MQPETSNTDSDRRSTFIESLSAFGRQHRAQHREGTFGDFLTDILPQQSRGLHARKPSIYLGHAALVRPLSRGRRRDGTRSGAV